MSEVNRSSAADDARAAARGQEHKKPKRTEKGHNPHTEKQQGKAYSRESRGSQSFEDVLKEASDATTTSSTAAAAVPSSKFDGAIQGVLREQNRDSHESEHEEDRDSDYKTTSKDKDHEGEGGIKKSGSSAEPKVHGKGGSKGQQQDSGTDSQNKGGKQFGGSPQRGFEQPSLQKSAFKNVQQAPAPGPIPVSMISTPQEIEAAQVPKELPKALLDQIVQYVTIKRGKDLDEEIQIQFNDKVFQGLRIKVTSHKGEEVSVELMVPNRSVEELFKNEREKIAIALGEKGVDLRDILVTRRNMT